MQNRRTVIGVFLLVLCVFVGIAAAARTFIFKDVVALPTAQETTRTESTTHAPSPAITSTAPEPAWHDPGRRQRLHLRRPAGLPNRSQLHLDRLLWHQLAGVAAGWCTNQRAFK